MKNKVGSGMLPMTFILNSDTNMLGKVRDRRNKCEQE